jgi:hypothetical protein
MDPSVWKDKEVADSLVLGLQKVLIHLGNQLRHQILNLPKNASLLSSPLLAAPLISESQSKIFTGRPDRGSSDERTKMQQDHATVRHQVITSESDHQSDRCSAA